MMSDGQTADPVTNTIAFLYSVFMMGQLGVDPIAFNEAGQWFFFDQAQPVVF